MYATCISQFSAIIVCPISIDYSINLPHHGLAQSLDHGILWNGGPVFSQSCLNLPFFSLEIFHTDTHTLTQPTLCV